MVVNSTPRKPARLAAAASLLALAILLLAATPALGKSASDFYTVHPLVSNVVTMAPVFDANLVNGWGIAAGPTTPWWVSDNGSDKSTLYDGTGTPRPLVVDVPGGPTGVVFNGTSEFVESANSTSAPARFMFATESGTILAWNPGVPSAGSTTAIGVVDRSGVGAVYKGLAIGAVHGKPLLYATDFANGRIDVFGGDFSLKNWKHAFLDKHLPKGYGPFGIQAIGGRLFVTYAKQNPPSTDELAGQGRGIVDEYRMDGRFVKRVASHGQLNAPWGLAKAPSDFGPFSKCLLVGNFGDGHINAYRKNGHGKWIFAGTLRTGNGKRLFIDGLWGIGFGNGNASGPKETLYFAAGPDGEANGLFGSVTSNGWNHHHH
jgi:uncharacterized protein (TIGR03118 family)